MKTLKYLHNKLMSHKKYQVWPDGLAGQESKWLTGDHQIAK